MKTLQKLLEETTMIVIFFSLIFLLVAYRISYSIATSPKTTKYSIQTIE